MNQEEFVNISRKQVKELNQGDESAEQAWRDGYLFAIKKIENILETKENGEALYLLEDMTSDSIYLDQF